MSFDTPKNQVVRVAEDIYLIMQQILARNEKLKLDISRQYFGQ